MPMMRRGPLDRFPVDWILRQAATNQASGTIELHGPRPVSIHLAGGRVTHLDRTPPDPSGRGAGAAADPPTDATPGDESTARRRVVDVLATLLTADEGWYYHDPLAVGPATGPWSWEVAGLLMDARACAHEHRALGPWSDRRVGLRADPASATVTLGPDAWAVITAIAADTEATEVRSRLGWRADRLVAALDELVSCGAARAATQAPEPRSDPPASVAFAGLPAPPVARPTDAAAAIAAAEDVVAGAADAAVPVRWPGQVDGAPPRRDTAPPPPTPVPSPAPAADDRRSALRRLIQSLRPA